MENIFNFLEANIVYTPFILFILLILAGCNVPISEDLIIIMGALISLALPKYTLYIYTSIFLGAYIGDLICYSIGKFLKDKIENGKLINPKKINKVQDFFHKYGAVTLFLGRFIPFGIRNAIFLSAGMGEMNFKKFAIYDFFSALISITTYFCLTLLIGNQIDIIVARIHYILFILFLIVLMLVLNIKLIKRKRYKIITTIILLIPVLFLTFKTIKAPKKKRKFDCKKCIERKLQKKNKSRDIDLNNKSQ